MFNRAKKYKVLLDNDDWVNPEDTLIDLSSEHSDVEVPISDGIFSYLAIVFIISSVVILGFVFKFSIIDKDYFTSLALGNRTSNFPIPPPRGIIFDRLGRALAVNEVSFDLLVMSSQLNPENLANSISNLSSIIGVDEYELSRLLMEKSKDQEIFFVARGLSKDQAINIQRSDISGFEVISNTRRYYPEGRVFSHIIGYTGKVSNKDLDNDDYYFHTDTIGRLGIEDFYEDVLRGQHGRLIFDFSGGEQLNKDPQPGNNLVLNIDYDLQNKLFNELRNELASAGLLRGAAIVQNPNNGEVLALVSFPSFDNNIFNNEVSESDYSSLFENALKPLFNRIIGGLYNPGSTIKPFIGMIALQEGTITSSSTVRDCVSITIDNPFTPGESYIFRNWRAELGLFDLKKAIANSCNIYFFSVGGGFGNITGVGINKISSYLKNALADSVLGVDLAGETGGFVPTPEWKVQNRNEPWYLGDTYNVSIGQGDLIITPLWLNTYISAIANGGTMYKPRIADRIVDGDKNTVEIFSREQIGNLGISPDNIEEMRNAMRETVLSGTARILNSLPVAVGAKSGTAEVIKGRALNSLFVAFAPFDNPELTITILVEGSDPNQGQGFALRVANNLLKWHFVERDQQ